MKKRSEFLNKIHKYLKKGGGEMIGFLTILPGIIFILVILISMVQLGNIKERLEYTAYLACRQAVVASDKDKDGKYMDDAEEIAQRIAVEDLNNSAEIFKRGTVKAKLTMVKGKNLSNTWEKGNYVRCTVSVVVDTITPFLSGVRSSSIVMMIEKPAGEGGTYPWFEHF